MMFPILPQSMLLYLKKMKRLGQIQYSRLAQEYQTGGSNTVELSNIRKQLSKLTKESLLYIVCSYNDTSSYRKIFISFILVSTTVTYRLTEIAHIHTALPTIYIYLWEQPCGQMVQCISSFNPQSSLTHMRYVLANKASTIPCHSLPIHDHIL